MTGRRFLVVIAWLAIGAALIAAAVLLIAIGITRIGADGVPQSEPELIVAAHPILTRAEARAEIEAAGRTWSEFMAQTTDRPRYDGGFVRAWLNQQLAPTGEEHP